MRFIIKFFISIILILLTNLLYQTITMSPPLKHAKITLRRSAERGFADHGWLKTFHTFSFADYMDRRFLGFGNLRVLNEDRVGRFSGFPTHPHSNYEIFSYILSGELTHRDSMLSKNRSSDENGPQFYRMRRGDVQFTTGGTGEYHILLPNAQLMQLHHRYKTVANMLMIGIAHSEMNEANKTVHFLQIWVKPWKYGLKPRYHNQKFDEEAKKKAFLPILSPIKDGYEHADTDEATVAKIPNTIPIHQDFVMGAGIIEPGKTFEWNVGYGDVIESRSKRNVYIHVPMTNLNKDQKARIQLDDRDDVLEEGDGAFVSLVNAGDIVSVKSVGEVPAEVVILDSN